MDIIDFEKIEKIHLGEMQFKINEEDKSMFDVTLEMFIQPKVTVDKINVKIAIPTELKNIKNKPKNNIKKKPKNGKSNNTSK